MSSDDGYRDALAAAHSRIDQLERAAKEHRASNAQAATLAALHRERARVVGATQPPPGWERWYFLRVAIPLCVVSVVLAISGDWVFSSLGVVFAVAGWGGIGAFLRATAGGAARQLVLVDAKIAELESAMRADSPASDVVTTQISSASASPRAPALRD